MQMFQACMCVITPTGLHVTKGAATDLIWLCRAADASKQYVRWGGDLLGYFHTSRQARSLVVAFDELASPSRSCQLSSFKSMEISHGSAYPCEESTCTEERSSFQIAEVHEICEIESSDGEESDLEELDPDIAEASFLGVLTSGRRIIIHGMACQDVYIFKGICSARPLPATK